MVQGPFSAQTCRRLQENDKRWATKAILRLLCMLFAFVALIIWVRMVALSHAPSNHDFVKEVGKFDNDFNEIIFFVPIFISFFYCPLVLALVISVRHGRAIHPGWDTAADGSVLILGLLSMVISIMFGWFMLWETPEDDGLPDGFYVCNESTKYYEQCSPGLYTIGRLQKAAIVFLTLLTILHFILFFFDCRAVQKHRHDATKARLADYHIRMQYNRSPEDHAADNPIFFRADATTLPPAYEPPGPNSDVILPTDAKAVLGATKYA